MYINIQEAINLTGKSQATIYRLIRKPKSREFVKKANDTYIIDKEYLLKIFPAKVDDYYENQNDSSMFKKLDSKFELLQDFIKEYPAALVIEKDKRIADLHEQLKSKDDTIKELVASNKRLNEQNLEQYQLIISLQDRLDKALDSIIKEKSQKEQNVKGEKLIPQKTTHLHKGAHLETIDKVLIGLALLSSIALLLFLGMMLFNYLVKQ